MRLPSWLRSRVDRSRLAIGLAVGDVVAVGGFVVVGEVHHGRDPLVYPGVVAETLALFLAGWAVATLLGGLYTSDAVRDVRRALSWTIPAWVTATLLIHVAIAVLSFHGGTDWPFVVVTLGIGGVAVVGWRVLATVLVHWR